MVVKLLSRTRVCQITRNDLLFDHFAFKNILMNKCTIRYAYIWFPVLCLLLCCRSRADRFVPQRHKSIGESQYAEYCKKLEEAYAEENYYIASFYLANLKAPKELIYDNLKKSVLDDSSNCTNIFEIQYLAEEGYRRHLYSIDTNEFKKIFELCLLKNGKDSYHLYKLRELEETKAFLASREPLDSSLFNWKLIGILKEIDESDQNIRKRMRDINISDSEKERLANLRGQIDSINLLRVDSILTNFGYPTKKVVGYDYSSVIVIVIHHQSSPSVRRYYLDRIRKYISSEEIEMIESRTQEIMKNN